MNAVSYLDPLQLVCAMIFAYLSDKQRKRAPYLAAQNLITITGLFITAYHPKANIRYLGLFFVIAGSAGCIPGILAYVRSLTNADLVYLTDYLPPDDRPLTTSLRNRNVLSRPPRSSPLAVSAASSPRPCSGRRTSRVISPVCG
jgi:hypothetical protein